MLNRTIDLETFIRHKCANLISTKINRSSDFLKGNFTIIHGDLWPSNVMFRESSTSEAAYSVILDFQFAVLGHIANDFCTLLCTSIGAEDRRRNLNFYLDQYNIACQVIGHKLGFSDSDVFRLTIEDYNEYIVYGLILILMSFDTWIGGCKSDSNSSAQFKTDKLLSRFIGVFEDFMRF